MNIHNLISQTKGRDDILTIEATVITGFEFLALDECREKCKPSSIVKAKGRIFFNIPATDFNKVLTLRAVDNIFLVTEAIKFIPFEGNKDKDLSLVKSLVDHVKWETSLAKWANITDFKGNLYPSKTEGLGDIVKERSELQEDIDKNDFEDNTVKDPNFEVISLASRIIESQRLTKIENLTETCLTSSNLSVDKISESIESKVEQLTKDCDNLNSSDVESLISNYTLPQITVKTSENEPVILDNALEVEVKCTKNNESSQAVIAKDINHSSNEEVSIIFPSESLQERKFTEPEKGLSTESVGHLVNPVQNTPEKNDYTHLSLTDVNVEPTANNDVNTNVSIKSDSNDLIETNFSLPIKSKSESAKEFNFEEDCISSHNIIKSDKEDDYCEFLKENNCSRKNSDETKAERKSSKKSNRGRIKFGRQFTKRVPRGNGTENTKSDTNDGILKFRATCYRVGGKHSFSSMDAACEFGGTLQDKFGWTVDLTRFDLNVVLNIEWKHGYICLALTKESLHRRNISHFCNTTLRATICYNLIRLAEPMSGEIIIDPLCGGGSISIEGALSFPNTYHICGDYNEKAIERTRANVNHLIKTQSELNVGAVKWNIKSLPIKDQSVDVLVTDLPFGRRSGSKQQNQKLYNKVLFELAKVVKTGTGRACLLTYDKTALVRALRSQSIYWREIRQFGVNQGGLFSTVVLLLRKSTPVLETLDPTLLTSDETSEKQKKMSSNLPTSGTSDVDPVLTMTCDNKDQMVENLLNLTPESDIQNNISSGENLEELSPFGNVNKNNGSGNDQNDI